MRRTGRLRLRSSLEIAASRVSIGFECVERGVIKPEKCYDLLGASGVKHARCQTGWAVCEKEKGVYDFSWLDDIVIICCAGAYSLGSTWGTETPSIWKTPPTLPPWAAFRCCTARRLCRPGLRMSARWPDIFRAGFAILKSGTSPTSPLSGILASLTRANTLAW